MDTQNLDDLPATKGDIKRVLDLLESATLPGPGSTPEPENPLFIRLEKRLALIERLSREALGAGLDDVPIDAVTASLITVLAPRTLLNKGGQQSIDTFKMGKKLQFSLRGCIQLVIDAKRKAVPTEEDLAAYNHSRKVLKGVKRQVIN